MRQDPDLAVSRPHHLPHRPAAPPPRTRQARHGGDGRHRPTTTGPHQTRDRPPPGDRPRPARPPANPRPAHEPADAEPRGTRAGLTQPLSPSPAPPPPASDASDASAEPAAPADCSPSASTSLIRAAAS